MPKIRASTVAEHRAQARAAVLDAFDALLDERGYEAITLSDVAGRAGMARNTIYNYAPDKAALLAAAFARSGTSLGQEIGHIAEDRARPAAERLAMVVRLLLVRFTRGTQRLLLLHNVARTLSDDARAELAAPFDVVRVHVLRIVRDGVAAGEFAPPADLELTFELMVGVMQAATLRVAHDPGAAGVTVESVTTFLLNAIRPAG